MRTNGFRGRRIDNGEWIRGGLITWGQRTYIVISMQEYEVDPATVGQYTGIEDKNSKEICEDDIIECIASDNKPIRHLVKYNYEKGGYSQLLFMGNGLTCEPYDGGLISQNYICEMGKYIIGNIHDNPELLKGGEQ